MANIHSVAQTIREESSEPATAAEVGAVDVAAGVRGIEGLGRGDIDEGDRWDGLS